MNWWKRIKGWFFKEPEVEEMKPVDQITYLLNKSARCTFKFDVKRSMGERITVYSVNVEMLREWLDLMIATVENNEYVPDKWKHNPEKLKRMTLDDFLTCKDGVIYPIECDEWLERKCGRLTTVLSSNKISPHKLEYYHRQFSPILDDVVTYLTAVIRCSV